MARSPLLLVWELFDKSMHDKITDKFRSLEAKRNLLPCHISQEKKNHRLQQH